MSNEQGMSILKLVIYILSLTYIITGIMLIIIAPKLKPGNWFLGIRTKAARKNKTIYDKCNKLTGILMIIAGIVLAVFGYFLTFQFLLNSQAIFYGIFYVAILAPAIVGIIYSSILAKKY